MAARTKSKVTPKYKTRYQVKNWRSYEAALRRRGDITIWFDEDAIGSWNASSSGCPGGQRRYSDIASLTALTLRSVFQLPLRQTEGFVASLIGMMGLHLETPDHTTPRSLGVATQQAQRSRGLSSCWTVISGAHVNRALGTTSKKRSRAMAGIPRHRRSE